MTHKIDRLAMAAALAPLLGATLCPENETDTYANITLLVSPRLKLILRETKGRLEVIAYTIETHAEAQLRVGWPFLGRVTADASRPVEAIAKQIKSKLIDPDAEPLAKYDASIAAALAGADRLAILAAEWQARLPSLRVNIQSNGHTANLSYSADGRGYWSARLNADGGLYLDRGTLTPEQAESFADIFAGVK